MEYRNINIYHNNPSRNNTSLHLFSANSFPLIINDNGLPQTILNPTVPVKVNVVADVTGFLTQHHFIKFTLNDLNSTNDEVRIIPLLNAEGGNKHYDLNYEFSNLNPLGNYEFTLEYYQTSNTGDPTFLNAVAQITFANKTSIINYKPGIRIKRTKNYTSTGSNPIITRYYYNKIEKRFSSTDSETFIRKPNFISESIFKGSCYVYSLTDFACNPYTIYSRNIHSDPQNNLYTSDNNRSIYEFVTVSYGGDNFENGGKQSKFLVNPDSPLSLITFNDGYVPLKKASNLSLRNGTLLNEIYFSQNNQSIWLQNPLKEITYTYSNSSSLPEKDNKITNCFVTKIHEIPHCLIISNSYVENILYGYYEIFSWWHNLEKTETKEYLSNGIVNSRTEYFYDSKLAGLPSRTVNSINPINTSTTDVYEAKTIYPQDVTIEPFMTNLINQHRFETVGIKNLKNGILLSSQKTIYKTDNNFILPMIKQTSKGLNESNLENRIVYNRYDSKGNPEEIFLQDGTPVFYIWGYNQTQPIAKIENTTFLAVQSQIENLRTLSNNGNEAALIYALNLLRNSLPNAMTTTYTYKPLVGISTVTDPKGNQITYQYDSNNRLQNVKDKNGNIVSENQYNYRPN